MARISRSVTLVLILTFLVQIDLHGMTVIEALQQLQKHIDAIQSLNSPFILQVRLYTVNFATSTCASLFWFISGLLVISSSQSPLLEIIDASPSAGSNKQGAISSGCTSSERPRASLLS